MFLYIRGLKDKYEIHHGIKIRDEAIISAVKLSDRYINNRKLPDKAIDLIDEAASKLKIELESSPIELEKLEREVLQLEIERTALLEENSHLQRRQVIDAKIETLKFKKYDLIEKMD